MVATTILLASWLAVLMRLLFGSADRNERSAAHTIRPTTVFYGQANVCNSISFVVIKYVRNHLAIVGLALEQKI